MTNLSDLQAAKTALVAKIATLYSDPKPTYSVDGQSVSRDQFRQSLLNELKTLNELLAQEGDPDYAPFEEVQKGVT